MSDIFKGCLLVGFGTLEGYAFLKAGLLNPQAVHDQMLFKSFIVMKLFLSAVGSSMVAQALLSEITPSDFEKNRRYSNGPVGYFRAMGGCFVLGIGMAVSGSGPTLFPGQLAAGAASAPYVILGALAAGVTFGLVESKIIRPSAACGKAGKQSLDSMFGVRYAAVAAPMGMLLLAATLGLEYLFPHSQDSIPRSCGIQDSMLPILAGLTVGLNQIPLRYLSGKGQGGSSSVMNIVATATNGAIAPKFKLTSIMSASQLLYVYGGTFLGAYYALSRTPAYAAPAGYGAAQSFIGGFLVLFGSRFADGCTCGHGITGFSELSVQSIAAAMSIFAGGIATALVLG